MEVLNRTGERGFSLIEVLVAAVILLVILLGLAPLFYRATVQNVAGRESTAVTNLGETAVEEVVRIPLGPEAMTVEVGKDERRVVRYWSHADKEWSETEPTDSVWLLTRRVRQFGIFDLEDEGVGTPGKLNNPLTGGTDDRFVHLREVAVEVESEREGGPLGAGKRIELSTLRAY